LLLNQEGLLILLKKQQQKSGHALQSTLW